MDQYPPQNQPNYPPPGYPQQPGYPPQPGPTSYPTEPAQPGFPPRSDTTYPPNTPYPGVPAYPPPDYPAQPGYLPPQPARKKRGPGLWIGILVVVVILGAIGGVGYFVVLPKIQQITPNSTLQTFCDGYKNLDAQKVYSTLSSQEQSTTSESTLEQGFTLIRGLGATINSCTVSNVQVNGSTATATITLSISVLGVTQTQNQSVSLVLENGAWKIDKMQNPSQP